MPMKPASRRSFFSEPLVEEVTAIVVISALGSFVAYWITRATCMAVVWVMDGFDADNYDDDY